MKNIVFPETLTQGRIRVLALWLADAVSFTLSWGVVASAYKALGYGAYDLSAYLAVWPAVFVFTGINWVARLYHGRGVYPGLPLEPVEEFRRLLLSSLATHVLIMAFLGFQHRVVDISRFVLAASGVFLMFLAQPMRSLVRELLFKTGIGQMPAYVIGDGHAGERLKRIFAKSAYYGFRIIRHFSRNEIGPMIEAARASRTSHLFCCYKDDRFFRAQLPELAGEFNFIEYMPTAQQFPVSGANAFGVGPLGGLEMVSQRRLKFLRLEKSVLDRLMSLAIFTLTLPLFVIVPILIKLTSKGPVFYRAARLGKKGRPIRVWKFRSMYADADARLEKILAEDPAAAAEWAANFKLKDDPRITPLGRFLRKTSIDELPQLLNVFTHEMALIGPRPIVEKEVAYYGKAYEIFSSVKPGITGLWQASGRSDCDYDERVALDVHYVLNWSPWMDLWIVYRTVAAVLKMKGSY